MRRLSISNKLLILVLAPLVAIIALSAIAYPLFQRVKVNGPQYRKIKATQDLVADILPPPNYILEINYLAGQALLSERPEFNQIEKQLSTLQQVYGERQAYWAKNLNDAQIAKPFLMDSKASAEQYFSVLNADFLPAMEKAFDTGWSPQDQRSGSFVLNIAAGEADGIYRNQLNALYKRHRTAIDETVTLARAKQTRLERNASDVVSRSGLLMLSLAALSMVAVALVGAAIRRSVRRPIAQLTAAANRASNETLPDVVSALQIVGADDPVPTIEPIVLESGDELEQLANAFTSMQSTAVTLASQQALARRNVSENLVNLGRRNQALLGRTLALLTELERSERDPDKLDDLFRVDHLATRMRRNAESLLVLAGAEKARSWSEPIVVGDVVRAAVSAVESFERVDIVELEQVKVKGSYVSDVAHLLAELIENATSFSAPDTRVAIIGKHVAEGYLLVITDNGIGITPTELESANIRMAEVSAFESAPTKVLGLNVVGRLAQRLGITVSLAPSATSGTAARVLIPVTVLEGNTPEHARPTSLDQSNDVVAADSNGFDNYNPDDAHYAEVAFDHNHDAVDEEELAQGTYDLPVFEQTTELAAELSAAGSPARDLIDNEWSSAVAVAPELDGAIASAALPLAVRRQAEISSPEIVPEAAEDVLADVEADVSLHMLAEVPPSIIEGLPASVEELHDVPETRRGNRLANLSRRVRGAQMPDTGPELQGADVPEREPEMVKNSLQSLQSGVNRGRNTEVSEFNLADVNLAQQTPVDESTKLLATLPAPVQPPDDDSMMEPAAHTALVEVAPVPLPVVEAPVPASGGRLLVARVRGAQMPDTGPAPEEPGALTDPEAVRSALSSLQAGMTHGRKAADDADVPFGADADEFDPSVS